MIMPIWLCYRDLPAAYYERQAKVRKDVEAHYRAKGISSESRLTGLVSKWLQRKGHTLPT